MKDFIVYVVWGPDATWGDGVGVHGYFLSEEEAEEYAKDETQYYIDEYGEDQEEWPWPAREVDYYVEPTYASELLFDSPKSLKNFSSRDAVIDYLNSRLRY